MKIYIHTIYSFSLYWPQIIHQVCAVIRKCIAAYCFTWYNGSVTATFVLASKITQATGYDNSEYYCNP